MKTLRNEIEILSLASKLMDYNIGFSSYEEFDAWCKLGAEEGVFDKHRNTKKLWETLLKHYTDKKLKEKTVDYFSSILKGESYEQEGI
jgi:hypothetical protein